MFFFFPRDLSDWTWVKLTGNLTYKGPSTQWLEVATPDPSGVFGSLKLVGRLQHERPNCGTRKESQKGPYFFWNVC